MLWYNGQILVQIRFSHLDQNWASLRRDILQSFAPKGEPHLDQLCPGSWVPVTLFTSEHYPGHSHSKTLNQEQLDFIKKLFPSGAHDPFGIDDPDDDPAKAKHLGLPTSPNWRSPLDERKTSSSLCYNQVQTLLIQPSSDTGSACGPDLGWGQFRGGSGPESAAVLEVLCLCVKATVRK